MPLSYFTRFMPAALAAILALACATPVQPALTREALENAEYRSTFSKHETVRLQGGEYREEIVPGAASQITVMLGDRVAFGDLNGDGLEDAAVVLIMSGGGTGNFRFLSAILNENAKPREAAQTLLGDRVRIESLSIRDGLVFVELLSHRANDPMPQPTFRERRLYELRNGELQRLNAGRGDR
jgi:hypothetical protein